LDAQFKKIFKCSNKNLIHCLTAGYLHQHGVSVVGMAINVLTSVSGNLQLFLSVPMSLLRIYGFLPVNLTLIPFFVDIYSFSNHKNQQKDQCIHRANSLRPLQP
jgi:hypothetical protein